MMEYCPNLLNKYFRTPMIILLFSFYYVSFASRNPYFVQEMDALQALKAMFNDPFLNRNWSSSGLHCSQWYGIQCSNDHHVTAISLEGMSLTGNVSGDAFMNFPELTLISLRNNSLSGNVMNFSSNRKLKHIDLSGNRLYGPISTSLLSLKLLESLQLQDNSLTGPLPEFNQSSLKMFNVSNNNLSGGAIPITTPSLKSFNHLEEQCGPPSTKPCGISENDTADSDDKDSKPPKFGTMFFIFDVIGLVAVMLLFLLYWKKVRDLKKKMKSMQQDLKQVVKEHDEEGPREEEKVEEIEKKVEMTKKKLIFAPGVEAGFELDDLLKASAEGLGRGLFGNTYRAKLEGWKGGLAVKRVRDLKPLSNEEFTKQLHIIAHLNYPNLLPLLAYYYSKEEKLMVYNYAEKGNLFNRIHGNKSSKERIAFRWSSRLLVARGVARALEYLHLNTKSSGVAPHGNLKSTNVLFDEHETVLVSDYGLSSMVALPIAAQRMVAYKSPEYQATKRVSRKSDVWSYGCLLLELLTARVSVHSAPRGIDGVDLSSWVHRAVREEWTAEIFDQEISMQRSAVPGMLKLLQVALRCCDKSPDKRPDMTEVVRAVENIMVVESESEEDLSVDPSLTEDSLSITADDQR